MPHSIIQTTTLTPQQSQQINDLWDAQYPTQLRGRFPLLLDGVAQYHHYLILDEGANVAAWAVDFFKDGEMRFSIIVSAAHQGKGLGRQLIARLRQENELIYGWVIDHDNDVKHDGTPYISPLPFYQLLGCTVLGDQRISSPMLSAVKIRL